MVSNNYFQMSQYTRSSLILYRIPEVVFVIVTGGVAVALAYSGRVIPPNRMTIPDISFPSNSGFVTVQNPTNSYPINLDGNICFPSDIYSCISLKESGASLTAGCCTALYDVNIDPTQTISSPFVIFLGIIIPFIVFIIRAAMWRLYISRQWSPPSEAYIATPCSPYYLIRGALFSVISVPPVTLNILIHLYRNSARKGSSAWTSSIDSRQQNSRNINNQLERERLNGALDMDINEECRYEIIDSNGNTIKTRTAGGEEDGRDRDIELSDRERGGGGGERGREYDPSPPQSSDVLNESFLGNNKSLGTITMTATPASFPLQQMFWLLLTYEPSFSLAIASAFQAIICLGLKRYVGAPRPNYFALSTWASIFPLDRLKDAQSARFSFPSGHSATAAAGLGLLIMVLLRDIKKLKRKYKQIISNTNNCNKNNNINNNIMNTNVNSTRSEDQQETKICSNTGDIIYMIVIFSLLIMLSVCLILWVGGSRIRDYYHFAPDVIGTYVLRICICICICAYLSLSASLCHSVPLSVT